MCDDETKQLLTEILYSLQSEKYEPGGFFTVGGLAAIAPLQTLYVIKSPFNTECEYCVYSYMVVTNRVYVAVSDNPAIIIPDVTGAVGYGLASQGNEGNPIRGIFITQSANGGNSMVPVWSPLAGNANLYVAMGTNAANTAAYVTVAFRRSYVHSIPDMPRQQAHTHSLVQSRRMDRMIPLHSKQESGYAAQYPYRARGREAYSHEDVPYREDVAALNPLTPDVSGMRGRRGR